MANNDYPHGLNAVMSKVHDTPRMSQYLAGTTTAIFRGDVLTLKTNGRVARTTTPAGADNIIGVSNNYIAAGVAPPADVWVYDDPDTIFEIQSDGTTDPGASTAQAHIGAGANIIYAAGDTGSGQSKVELDYSSIAAAVTTSGGIPIRVVGHYNIAGNDMTLMHARYLVQFNRTLNYQGRAI